MSNNIRHKKRSRNAIMRMVRSGNTKNKRSDLSSSNTDEESTMFTQEQSSSNIDNVDDLLNFYLIMHMKCLMSLLKQTLCYEWKNFWDGSATVKIRNGLYMHLEFTCNSCGSVTHLHSSPQVENSKRREINIRLQIGGTLSGMGHHDVLRLLGALNLPPPTQEDKYSETQDFILSYVEKAQEQSMVGAVEEAVTEGGGTRELTVSGGGAWLTRGHSSAHGIAALCSAIKRPKVLDTTWSSKKCSKCQGAESLRHVNPDLHKTFQENHHCQLNYQG
jgi:hypothetical protein